MMIIYTVALDGTVIQHLLSCKRALLSALFGLYFYDIIAGNKGDNKVRWLMSYYWGCFT